MAYTKRNVPPRQTAQQLQQPPQPGEPPRRQTAEELAAAPAKAAQLEADKALQELAAAQEVLRQQQAAYQAQLAQENQLKAQYASELKATEQKALIAGKRSTAASSRIRSQAQMEAVQLQQKQQATALQMRQQQRAERAVGATVGQPGRSRTRVSTSLSIGGYGGSSAGRINPTGLNI
jgi:hypothetical protein